MRVLGIDPGLAIVGYSVCDYIGNSIKLLEYGCITTKASDLNSKRLLYIAEQLDHIIREFQPTELAIEELFFNKNVKTAITVAQARGVEILTCKKNNMDIYEYTPLQIKQAIVGYGRAEKIQIQESIKMMLNLSEIPTPDDAADAIAVNMCHCFSSKFKDLYKV